MGKIDETKLEIALAYVSRMAEGNHPVKNRPVEEDSVLNDPNVIRCMYFIKDVLHQVKDNGGMIGSRSSKSAKSPFPLEVLSKFVYREDTSITHFLAQLKLLAEDPDVKGIGIKPITEWLKQMDYLLDEYEEGTGQKKTRTTPKGEQFGLYMEPRVSARGQEYNIIMYSRRAQEFIVQHMEAILNGEILTDVEQSEINEKF